MRFPDLGVSGSIIMTLMQPYLDKSHNLFLDSWFTSPTLFEKLHTKSTGGCGTVRAVLPDAKPENPEFQSQNPEKFLKVSFDCLRSSFLYLHNISLNETIENTHQNIVNSMNKKLSITHFAVNLHVVFSTTFFHYNT